MIFLKEFIFLIATYLICSIPFGLLLTKIFTGKDIRKMGSKNIGATNVTRIAGKKLGLATLLLDGFKGAIMIIIARFTFADSSHLNIFLILIAMAGVLGHIYSAYLKFKGGKGVATTLAILLAIDPLVGIPTVLSWIIVFLIWKTSSISSLCSIFLSIIFSLYYKAPMEQTLLCIFLSTLVILRHKENIFRLIKGKENKIL